jgi:RNA polymerase I, Rpa2 specific domain
LHCTALHCAEPFCSILFCVLLHHHTALDDSITLHPLTLYYIIPSYTVSHHTTLGPDDRDDWAMDKSFKKLLSSVGVIPLGTGGGDGQLILGPAFIPVLIDGVVFGGMKASRGADIVAQLRLLKVTGGTDTTTRIDPTTELAFFPYSALGGAYAGLYIFTQPGRLIRPVLSLKTRTVEWIGPMEQVFMDIACLAEDRRAETTHMELGPGIMLSQVASMTPFRYRIAYCILHTAYFECCEHLLIVIGTCVLTINDISMLYFSISMFLI